MAKTTKKELKEFRNAARIARENYKRALEIEQKTGIPPNYEEIFAIWRAYWK